MDEVSRGETHSEGKPARDASNVLCIVVVELLLLTLSLLLPVGMKLMVVIRDLILEL